MNTLLECNAGVFDAEHFRSDCDRYAALVVARARLLGKRATSVIFADYEQRELLMLPDRAPDVASRRRLIDGEIGQATTELEERESALAAMGKFDAPLFRNAALLGSRLGLTDAEREVVVLAVATRFVRLLREAMEALRGQIRARSAAADVVSILLGIDRTAVAAALSARGTLAKSGLVQVSVHDEDEPLLRVLPDLAAILFDEFESDDALFEQFARPGRLAKLSWDDFAHLEPDIDILRALLAEVARTAEPGINIMFHGPPGTGKTELARVLAQAAGLRLHEVRHTDSDGDAIRRARYGHLVVAQRLLATCRDVALVFDEAEDLLPYSGDRGESASENALGKAGFNDLLETNPVPVIWTSNEIDQIDAAYLRRFAYVLEVKTPNRTVRKRIIARAFGDLVRPDWVDRVAELETASPGYIAQAARVARLATAHSRTAATVPPSDPAKVAERALCQSLRVRSGRLGPVAAALPPFDPAYLNCGADIGGLIRNLRQHPSGALLFYGPPGTGKTALAGYIAREIDRPLVSKRASDLLSPWVGESERKIADAFDQAGAEGAVLVLDEADSFLADRRDARARWEVTETNELLTQMESFQGVFICSTNLVDRLDRAALRRFALKLRFDSLLPAQARSLARAAMIEARIGGDLDAALDEVEMLHGLTPGDVAAVAKRWRLVGRSACAADFARALREELDLKGAGAARRIGF